MLHDGLAVGIDLGDVHAVQVEAAHGVEYIRVAKGGFFQHLAGHTPFGEEIHQHRFAGLAGGGQRLLQ